MLAPRYVLPFYGRSLARQKGNSEPAINRILIKALHESITLGHIALSFKAWKILLPDV